MEVLTQENVHWSLAQHIRDLEDVQTALGTKVLNSPTGIKRLKMLRKSASRRHHDLLSTPVPRSCMRSKLSHYISLRLAKSQLLQITEELLDLQIENKELLTQHAFMSYDLNRKTDLLNELLFGSSDTSSEEATTARGDWGSEADEAATWIGDEDDWSIPPQWEVNPYHARLASTDDWSVEHLLPPSGQ